MSFGMDYGVHQPYAVANAPADARAAFIRRTYAHLGGAILAFVTIEAALFTSGVADSLVAMLFGAGRLGWIALMIAFIGGGYLAQGLARSATSDVARYLGLAGYVVLEAVIFLPLLWIAERQFPGQYLAAQAGIVTLAIFAGLTLIVAVTGKNFSFMGPFLGVLSFAALGLMIASMIFGFSLGIVFIVAMCVLASGYILFSTSRVMHEFREDQHVAAALELFAAVALLFWYILQIFLRNSSSD
ncbi:MAG: Bax inhibitor-1 family protein [Bacteroidales bacterium]|nr:Bax inhibitor-1 family protein [Bacteroidales bacterium]